MNVLLAIVMLFNLSSGIETRIIQSAMDCQNVKSAECIIYLDTAYIAIITEPLFLRSENEKVIRDVQNKIKRHGYKIIAVIDTGLYFELTRLKERESKMTFDEKMDSYSNIVVEFAKRYAA